MKSFFKMSSIELKLSLRSPDVLLFVMIMPVVITLLIGWIFRENPPEGFSSILEMTFGALISIGICAVGLMGLPLVLSDYREKKVLKRLQVTPASPWLLLSVQLAVQFLVALISCLMTVLTVMLLFGIKPVGSFMSIAFAWVFVLAAIFALGMIIASMAKNSKQAGVLCSILYFPMLLFSGTSVPFSVFPEWLQKAASLLPLRQGIVLLNGISQGQPFRAFPEQITLLFLMIILGVFLSLRFFRWDYS